jgi:hypothetical protein
MGTIRDQETGEIVGVLSVRMDNIGQVYWLATAGGVVENFYQGPDTSWTEAEHRAVTWIMETLEEAAQQ